MVAISVVEECRNSIRGDDSTSDGDQLGFGGVGGRATRNRAGGAKAVVEE